MTKEDRAIAIIDLMTQTMGIVEDGERAEQVACTLMARAANADCGVLIGVDLNQRLRVHGAWPDHRRAAALVEAALRGGARTDGRPASSNHQQLGEVVTLGTDISEGAAERERGRLVVLARRGGFSVDSRELLSDAVGPLFLLLPHVADACLRAQHARTAAQAAAAYNLTARELEVLQLLAEGLLARTIAARLGLSPRTVHKHLSNVYTKLGVHDRLVAVSLARSQGLIRLESDLGVGGLDPSLHQPPRQQPSAQAADQPGAEGAEQPSGEPTDGYRAGERTA